MYFKLHVDDKIGPYTPKAKSIVQIFKILCSGRGGSIDDRMQDCTIFSKQHMTKN